MAQRDMSQNKPFNPNPRNEFGNRTHGYNGAFGDKNYYRSQYSSGYAEGYQSSYRGGRGWGYRALASSFSQSNRPPANLAAFLIFRAYSLNSSPVYGGLFSSALSRTGRGISSAGKLALLLALQILVDRHFGSLLHFEHSWNGLYPDAVMSTT